MSPASRPSSLQLAMAWLAIGLSIILLTLGIYWYGLSIEAHNRFWNDIFGRAGGPMTFRFVLQPAMALIAAIPDGLRDAREGHSSFFWTSRGDATVQHDRLRQGLIATARIMLLGLSMDAIYQYRVLDHFYPGEAVFFSLVLAVVPYFIWRWLVERIAARRRPHPHINEMSSPDE